MSRKRNQNVRSGSVTVEMALTAPILLMLIFACVEFSRVHMIQNAVENAAFEAARTGIVPGATAAACESAAAELLDFAGVKTSTVEISPSTITANANEITVTVNVPLDGDNGFGIAGFFKDRTLTKTITMPRESE